MSSFLVGSKCINNIIGWLNHSDNSHELRKVLEVAEIAQSDPDWMDKLGASMHALNHEAVHYRYNGRMGEGSLYTFHWENVSAVQALKSLRCWLYQCAEGTIDERPLFKVFDGTVSTGMAMDIVRPMPEWEAAEWG